MFIPGLGEARGPGVSPVEVFGEATGPGIHPFEGPGVGAVAIKGKKSRRLAAFLPV